MTKAPAFQFYAAEYLADMNVQLLTIEQEGVYIRLLAFCWREGKVPNDDARLASLCKGVSSSVLTPVKELFQLSDCGNFLIHKRLESERKKQKDFKKNCSNAGKKSAIVRKANKTKELDVNQPSTNVPTEPQPTTQPNGNSAFASSSSSSSAKTTTNTSAIAVIDLPDWVDREVWNAYLEMRKKKRAAPTGRALKGILTQLGIFRNKGHDPNAILDTSIRSNWTDVYEPKTGASNGNQSKGDATYDALRRSIQAGRNQGTAGEVGDTPPSEDGGTGVRGLLGRPDAVRDEGRESGTRVAVIEATR